MSGATMRRNGHNSVTPPIDPRAVPAVPTITVVALGGSHRALKNALNAFGRAGIRYKWLGPVAMNSKRHSYAIPTADVDRAIALDVGVTKSRKQWDWLTTTNPDTYFT